MTQLAQFSLTLTDTVLIGRLGGDALAAVGLGSTLYIVVYLLCMGILAAVPPLAAQAHGARNIRLMRRTIRQGLWVATLLGLLSILALWPAEKIFLILGQSPDIAIVSQDYVRAAVWGILPGLCVIAMRGFIAVMERPSFIRAVTCTGFLVNGLADYAFIFGVWGFPKLGVMGVGIATTVTNLAMCAAIMLIASKANRLRRYRVLGRFWRPDWSVFRDIFRVGTPITAMIMMEHMLFASATFMMGERKRMLMGTLLEHHLMTMLNVFLAERTPQLREPTRIASAFRISYLSLLASYLAASSSSRSSSPSQIWSLRSPPTLCASIVGRLKERCFLMTLEMSSATVMLVVSRVRVRVDLPHT